MATGRPGCTQEVFSHTACRCGAEKVHGEGERQRLQAGLSGSPATAAVARQGGCCCRRATEPPTFHLHSASREAGRCTYRLQSGADKVGLGDGRSGGPHDLSATAGHRRLLDTARRQHGSLEHEGSHDFALQQAAAVSTAPDTQGSRRTALCRSSAACLWPRHPPPAVQGTHGRRGRGNQHAAASQALVSPVLRVTVKGSYPAQ